MTAGAREQAASRDAFVLSRRQPAPDAPLKRRIRFVKIRGFKVADYNPRPAGLAVEHSPVRGTSLCAPGAFSLTAPVFRSSRAQKGAWCARDSAAERRHVGTGGGSAYRREQASASKDMRRCNQRQVTNAGRNKRERDRRSRSRRQQARTSTGVIRDR